MNKEPATAIYLRKLGYKPTISQKPKPINNNNNVKIAKDGLIDGSYMSMVIN